MRGLEAGGVHVALGLVDEVAEYDVATLLQRPPAGVPPERDREQVVMGFQQGRDELPASPCVGDPVYAEQRLTAAAAVEGPGAAEAGSGDVGGGHGHGIVAAAARCCQPAAFSSLSASPFMP